MMRISGVLAGLTAAVFSSAAMAHSGAQILTTSSKSKPGSMSGGVTLEEVNGVRVFRGGAPAETELLGVESAPETSAAKREIKIVLCDRPFRQIRRLRTQGFYSGAAYPSRRYRQGFYSSGR